MTEQFGEKEYRKILPLTGVNMSYEMARKVWMANAKSSEAEGGPMKEPRKLNHDGDFYSAYVIIKRRDRTVAAIYEDIFQSVEEHTAQALRELTPASVVGCASVKLRVHPCECGLNIHPLGRVRADGPIDEDEVTALQKLAMVALGKYCLDAHTAPGAVN